MPFDFPLQHVMLRVHDPTACDILSSSQLPTSATQAECSRCLDLWDRHPPYVPLPSVLSTARVTAYGIPRSSQPPVSAASAECSRCLDFWDMHPPYVPLPPDPSNTRALYHTVFTSKFLPRPWPKLSTTSPTCPTPPALKQRNNPSNGHLPHPQNCPRPTSGLLDEPPGPRCHFRTHHRPPPCRSPTPRRRSPTASSPLEHNQTTINYRPCRAVQLQLRFCADSPITLATGSTSYASNSAFLLLTFLKNAYS